MNAITRADVERALPANLKSSATQSLTDAINNLTSDPILGEEIQSNFITYAHILSEGKWSTEQYLSAVQYVTHKLMGRTNQDAYALTFPQRMNDLIARGCTSKDISAYVSAYHKSKLVNAIMEKCLIPVHVLHVDTYHQAIRVQADLMMNAQSEKVRQDAANSILTHLATPIKQAPTVAIQINNNQELDAMKKMMGNLAEAQLAAIESGMTAKDLASQVLIEHETPTDGTD